MQTRKAIDLDNASYVIEGGSAGRERLRLLTAAMEPLTESFLDRIGVTEGMHCLDVGCGGGDVTRSLARRCGTTGLVVGVDADAEVVAIAQSESASANAHFQCADVTTLECEPVDVIYARFLLSHVKDAPALLAHLRTLLKPGGVVAIEDVWFPGHFSSPQCDAFDTYVEWYRAAAIHRGADPDIGLRLREMLVDAGFEIVSHEMHTQAFGAGTNKLVTLITLERIAKSVVASGIASEEEANRVIADLRSFIERSDTIASMAPVVQIIGHAV